MSRADGGDCQGRRRCRARMKSSARLCRLDDSALHARASTGIDPGGRGELVSDLGRATRWRALLELAEPGAAAGAAVRTRWGCSALVAGRTRSRPRAGDGTDGGAAIARKVARDRVDQRRWAPGAGVPAGRSRSGRTVSAGTWPPSRRPGWSPTARWRSPPGRAAPMRRTGDDGRPRLGSPARRRRRAGRSRGCRCGHVPDGTGRGADQPGRRGGGGERAQGGLRRLPLRRRRPAPPTATPGTTPWIKPGQLQPGRARARLAIERIHRRRAGLAASPARPDRSGP